MWQLIWEVTYSTQVQSSSTPAKMTEQQPQGFATLFQDYLTPTIMCWVLQCIENMIVGLDHRTVD